MATFYFNLDSLSETPVSPLLWGGCWEAGSRDPSLHPASSAGPHFSPLLPLRTPEAPTSTLTRPSPIPPSIHPPAPQARQGGQTQSCASGTCCQRYQNKTFPKQCLTCLLVWFWGSPPLFPRAPPAQASEKRQ